MPSSALVGDSDTFAVVVVGTFVAEFEISGMSGGIGSDLRKGRHCRSESWRGALSVRRERAHLHRRFDQNSLLPRDPQHRLLRHRLLLGSGARVWRRR